MSFFTTVDFDCGRIFIESDGLALTRICFCHRTAFEILRERAREADDCAALQNAREQLEGYFSGTRQTFSLPLNLSGTTFQKKVWDALTKIPYGETRTYGEIAALADSPRAARAVGSANHINPFQIVIPCHRVVGASGALVGYAEGLETKRALLDLERRFSRCRQA